MLVCLVITPGDSALYNDWKNWVNVLLISCGSDERVPDLVIMLLMYYSLTAVWTLWTLKKIYG